MTPRSPTNVPHSVHQRLLNRAKTEGRPLQELLQYFAIERFLYRLGRSPHADRFLLKGALMLRVWDSPLARPTVDVDLLGRMAASEDALANIIRECFAQDAPGDGVRFDSGSLHTETIRVAAAYPGIRARFTAYIGKIRLPVQVDVGFGDAVVPDPEWIHFPTLLDLPPPRLLVYPPETAIAEKFHAMVELDTANSRMKDFYDIWTLAVRREFGGRVLSQAIRATFDRRKTPVPATAPIALTAAFAEQPVKRTQWQAFLRKGRVDASGSSLLEVAGALRDFLMPPARAAAGDERFEMVWPAGGPWRPA